MKLIVMFVAAALALAGCTTVEKLDTAIQKNIGQFCAGASQTQAVYLASIDLIPASARARVEQTYATVERICAEPEKASTVTITAAVAAHLAAIKAARNAAKE